MKCRTFPRGHSPLNICSLFCLLRKIKNFARWWIAQRKRRFSVDGTCLKWKPQDHCQELCQGRALSVTLVLNTDAAKHGYATMPVQIRPGSRCMLVSTCQFEVAHPRSRSNKRLSCRRGTARRSQSFGTAWMILFSYDDWRNRFPMALQTTDTLSLRVICR